MDSKAAQEFLKKLEQYRDITWSWIPKPKLFWRNVTNCKQRYDDLNYLIREFKQILAAHSIFIEEEGDDDIRNELD